MPLDLPKPKPALEIKLISKITLEIVIKNNEYMIGTFSTIFMSEKDEGLDEPSFTIQEVEDMPHPDAPKMRKLKDVFEFCNKP